MDLCLKNGLRCVFFNDTSKIEIYILNEEKNYIKTD